MQNRILRIPDSSWQIFTQWQIKQEVKLMRSKFVIYFVVFCSMVGIAAPSSAGMTSSSFQIPTSVFSGGGIPMGSATFQANSTLGQSSPIAGPISSTNFWIDSGFWHSIYYVSILKDSKGLPWLMLLLD